MAPRKPTAKNSITQSGRVIYLNNKELLNEVRESKSKGRMSDTLARMLQLICANFARKGNFVSYTYNTDMQAYAMMMLVRTWGGFDPDKGTNAFAWYTQCIKNSFKQYLNYERKHRDIRDASMLKAGLSPSHTYASSEGHVVEDEQEFDILEYVVDAPGDGLEPPVRNDFGMELEIDADCEFTGDVLEIDIDDDELDV